MPWRRWGPYLSERQWGTVREDYSARRQCLGLFPARSRAQPRLSLGRGRDCRVRRRPAPSLPRSRFVERAGPDPQGAAVRPDQLGRQSRRGRQGTLLLPRRHPEPQLDADAVQISAGRLSLCAACRRERPPRHERPGVRTARYRGVRRRPLFRRRNHLCEGGARRHPDGNRRDQSRPRSGAAASAAAALVAQYLVVETRRRETDAAAHRRRRDRRDAPAPAGDAAGLRRSARAAVLRERDQRAAALGPGCRRVFQGRHQRLCRRRRRRRGQSGRVRHQGRCSLQAADPRAAARSACACG